MKILRKSKEKIQCSLYPIHMPLELFSFTSLPSLCCKIELTCLSWSGAGHLAVWPHSAANEGIEWAPCWRGCGCWGDAGTGDIQQSRSCLNSMRLSLDTAALHGLCRNRTPSVCLLGQKTCRSEMSTFVLQDFLGLYVLFWWQYLLFCCYEVILVTLEVNLENQLTVTSSEDASCWYQNTWILV